VITVVRNDSAGLWRTRDSLRRQSRTDIDWMVVDGGSDDGGAAVLRSWAGDEAGNGTEGADAGAQPAPLVWARSGADGGPYQGMNLGLAAARAEYVWFLNAGDTLAGPETLAQVAAALGIDCPGQHQPERPAPDFLYGDADEREADGERRHKRARSHRAAWYGMFTHHQAMVFRRSLVAGLGFDPDYPVGADYALVLQTLARTNRVQRLRLPLCVFAPGGLSRRRPGQGRRDQWRIRRRLLGWNWPACLGLALVQQAAMTVRRQLPWLYRLYQRGRCCWPSGSPSLGVADRASSSAPAGSRDSSNSRAS